MALTGVFLLLIIIPFFALALILGLSFGKGYKAQSHPTGRVLNNPLIVWLTRLYPIVLLAALMVYYTLPADRFYTPSVLTEKQILTRSAEFSDLRVALEQGDSTSAELNNTPYKEAILPFEEDALTIYPEADYIVSPLPSEDGIIIVRYYYPQETINNYDITPFIQAQPVRIQILYEQALNISPDTPDGEPVDINLAAYRPLYWVSQFQDTPLVTNIPSYRNHHITPALLYVQVPQDVTVYYYGKDDIIKSPTV